MKSRDELFVNLNNIKSKYDYNKKLIEKMSYEFGNKGLLGKIPNQIFSGLIRVETLNNIELYMFTKILFEETNNSDIRPENYFTQNEINEFDNTIIGKEKVDRIVLENVIQIDDLHWICPYWDVYDIHKVSDNFLLTYNVKSQRELKNVRTSSGKNYQKINVNQKSVDDISQEVLENKFTPNMITLNMRLMDNNNPNYSYNPTTKELIIIPSETIKNNLISDDENKSELKENNKKNNNDTLVDVIDGWNRISGFSKAVTTANESNKILKGGLVVSIVCMTEEDARNYIARESKRNDMSKEYIKAIEKNDYNKIIDQMNNAGDTIANILKDNIGLTMDDVIYNNKLTTYDIMNSALKQTGLDTKDPIDINRKVPKLIDIVTHLVKYIIKYHFSNDKWLIKNKSFLLEPGIFIGYIAIAYELINNQNYLNEIERIGDNLVKLTNKDVSGFKLKSKTPNSIQIYKYFKELV